MRLNLQPKLLLLLFLVILIALSSSILLRNLIIRDFRAFVEGGMLDRLYQTQALLEGRYEKSGRWQKEELNDDLLQAWLSGIELRLYNSDGVLLLDTKGAIEALPPAMQGRILASKKAKWGSDDSDFQSYPLFFRDEEIGHIDVRLIQPLQEQFLINASNRFLLLLLLGLGLTATLLGLLAARRITRPLKELTEAAEGVASGETGRRVKTIPGDEIGRLALTFNRMAEKIEGQEQLRRELASNAAHELRTPLMIIKGELEGMIDGLLPMTPEGLQSLHDEAGRLTSILDGMDELTRAQTAALSLQMKSLPLMPFLKQISDRFARQAAEQKVQIHLRGDEWVIADIDPDHFSRVPINLISNALRAMPDGGRLDIDLTMDDDAAPIISFCDNGCGIQAERLPYLFERFYKGENGGLGLGLAIVKELVEGHGGEISVSSAPGKGSCFRIRLRRVNG